MKTLTLTIAEPWLRFYDKECNKTFLNAEAINYCPMCRRKLINQ